MERSLAMMWTCLLGAGLVLVPLQALSPPSVLPSPSSVPSSKAVLQPPRLIGCVFLNRANVTCRWEAGDTSGMNYTLTVEQIAETSNISLVTLTCNTSDTSCTVVIHSSVRFNFCISVTAHGHGWNTSSERRCQRGRIEVMLPPVPLDSVVPVRGRPQCLTVTWRRILAEFPVTESEIKAGHLKSQIEFTAQGQFDVQVENANVTDTSFQVCHFRPDTSYTIRLRHRYQGTDSPWSPWSNAGKGRTGEDAPSAAPAFWRRVKQTDESGRRLVSLLWKPLPHFLANGRVLFFNVTCQTDSTQILNDHGSCRHLHNESTSCSLHLPAGRCACALTASTSAGMSPEARIWLFGAFETEPPAPSQITASPLDDSSVDVRWTAPVDRSVSGFVVEWFAVREESSSSVLHWEMLNSFSTSLVITEGVKPMERYAVSVKALYGERRVGQNRTVHIYTRQGAPSAGPNVQVQQIFGSTVEIIWNPVPVELRHGFIRNYTIVYSSANQTPRRELVPGHVLRHSLKNLRPGNYDIFMQANTDAGAGAAGPIANVHISEASDEISILMSALLPVMLTALALALMACLAQSKMVKQKLCQDVPDPSNSSLAHWTPKITLESLKRPAMAEKAEIKYSQVILLGESELQNPDKDLTYQSVCHLQTHTQTLQNTRNPEKKSVKSSTKAETTSNTDLSSCPYIYSNIVFSHTLKNHPSPLRSPSCLQSNDWQDSTVSVNDTELQLGGAGELPVSLQKSDSPQTHELKTLHRFLRQHQSPVSFSDFSSISPSSVLFSHPAEITSSQHSFSQSQYNSVPSLQPDTFTQTNPLFDTFTKSLSTFPHSVSVDFSYCPLECDPYVPCAL